MMKSVLHAAGTFGLLLAMLGVTWAGQGTEDVPTLLKKLKHQDAKVRKSAIEDLGHIGAIKAEATKGALSPILKMAKSDKDASVRQAAVMAAAKLDPEPEEVLPTLKAALKDKDERVKMSAIQALGLLGPKAKDALPELREIMKGKDKDKKASQAAGMAVRSINESSKK